MNERNCKVISFINMKGGVGKTTLTINIGKQLANMNKKTLIIDMDPQFNATQSLLLYKTQIGDSDTGLEYTIIDEQDEEIIVKQEITSSEYYRELSNKNETALQLFESTDICEGKTLTKKILDNLYLIPGDLNLSKEISGDTSGKVGAVYNYIQENNILSDFDYVLIDCPPTWSILTHSSLFASDYYIIPSKVDLYSSIGISLLEEQIEKKIRKDTVHKQLRGDLKRLGVIFSLVHRKIIAEQGRMEHIKSEFPEIKFLKHSFPHIPSASTRFTMIDEVKNNPTYSELVNSIEKITYELIERLSEEGNNE